MSLVGVAQLPAANIPRLSSWVAPCLPRLALWYLNCHVLGTAESGSTGVLGWGILRHPPWSLAFGVGDWTSSYGPEGKNAGPRRSVASSSLAPQRNWPEVLIWVDLVLWTNEFPVDSDRFWNCENPPLCHVASGIIQCWLKRYRQWERAEQGLQMPMPEGSRPGGDELSRECPESRIVRSHGKSRLTV